VFTGLRFQSHAVRLDTENLSDAVANRFFERCYFGLFGEHNAIEVHQLKSFGRRLLPGVLEHIGRVASGIPLVRIWKQLANVTQRRGAKNGIRDGVQQYIRVTVSNQVP